MAKNKNKKEKAAYNFKIYNLIMSNVWRFLTTLLIGVLGGYLASRNGPKGNNYWLIMILVFLVIGLNNIYNNPEYRQIPDKEKMVSENEKPRLIITEHMDECVEREEAKKQRILEKQKENEENESLENKE